MKYFFSILSLLAFSFCSWSQNKHFNTLTNEINLDSLKQHALFHFDEQQIIPNNTDTLIKQWMHEYRVIIFLGTWCSDSQELLPQIHNYFTFLNLPESDVIYYGLEENKTSTNKWEEQFNVTFVPTIIIVDKTTGKEKGRIVERFTSSLTEDLYEILKP